MNRRAGSFSVCSLKPKLDLVQTNTFVYQSRPILRGLIGGGPLPLPYPLPSLPPPFPTPLPPLVALPSWSALHSKMFLFFLSLTFLRIFYLFSPLSLLPLFSLLPHLTSPLPPPHLLPFTLSAPKCWPIYCYRIHALQWKGGGPGVKKVSFEIQAKWHQRPKA